MSRNFLLHVLVAVALVLPWLSSYTAGPTPNAWPWLISAFCAIIMWCFHRQLDFKLIAIAWIIAAAISSLIGVLQYFGLAAVFDPWISQTGAGEAFANLRQRNQFATLTSIGLLGLIALVAWHSQDRRVPWWVYGLALLLALGNAVSGSRTGLLQWAVILVLTAFWSQHGTRRLFILALQAAIAYVIAGLALPWLLAAITNVASEGIVGRLVETQSCTSRLILWSNVLNLIVQKPWLGWGWGELDYAHFMTLYSGPRFCEILDNAHNLPLHIAVELGVPVSVVVCGLGIWAVWRGKPWRETDPARQMAWGVLAVILLHSMLEYPLWYGPFQIAFGLCVALLLARRTALEGRCVRTPPAKTRWLGALSIQVLMVGSAMGLLIFASLEYYKVSQIYLAPEQRGAGYRDDTLNKIRDTWFFRSQARFAELSVTPLTRADAQWTFDTATALLHYSPEPSVVEKVIESAVMLGRDQDALMYLARYKAAFPEEHARWVKAHAGTTQGLQYLR